MTTKQQAAFFEPLENTRPFVKIGLSGFSGTGKSYTACQIALGLHRLVESKRPIVLFDTEQTAKFLKPRAKEVGVDVLVKRSRSLADLREVFKFARDGGTEIVLIDSVTHIWLDWLSSYKDEKNRKGRLFFQDWAPIKDEWRKQFSDPFVNDPVHYIMCGRAQWEWEMEKDEESGQLSPVKGGIKMAAERETAFETDLYALLEIQQDVTQKPKRIWRSATIFKDRSSMLDGKTLNYEGFDSGGHECLGPDFQDFLPSIKAMLCDPFKAPETESTPASSLVDDVSKTHDWIQRKEIALEEIKATLTSEWPGQTAAEKKNKVDALDSCFGTKSWKKVETLSPDDLEDGLSKLRKYLKADETLTEHWKDLCNELGASDEVTKKVRAWVHAPKTPDEVLARRYHAREYITKLIEQEVPNG